MNRCVGGTPGTPTYPTGSLRLRGRNNLKTFRNQELDLHNPGCESALSSICLDRYEFISIFKRLRFSFNLAAKWKRKYRGWAPEEGWFVLKNLEDLESAIGSYQKRFGIEEMFRDFKSGGYDLEGTNVTDERLIGLVLLIAIAYTAATMQGKTMKGMGIQKYVGRVQEAGRIEQRHSCFYIGLYGQTWVNFSMSCEAQIEELMQLSRNKVKY